MAAIWLYSRDVKKSAAFYEGVLGLRKIDEHGGTAHFDAGGIRVSLHPSSPDNLPARGSFLVFIIPSDIDRVYFELKERGAEFKGPLREEEFGRAAFFHDPDGHELWIWQPPALGDKRNTMVAPLVDHYTSVAERLRRSSVYT